MKFFTKPIPLLKFWLQCVLTVKFSSMQFLELTAQP